MIIYSGATQIPSEAVAAVRKSGIMAVGHLTDKDIERILIAAIPFLISQEKIDYLGPLPGGAQDGPA